MKIFTRKRKDKFVLRVVGDNRVTKNIFPGDILHLTHSFEYQSPAKKSLASVTVTYEWDGRTLRQCRS